MPYRSSWCGRRGSSVKANGGAAGADGVTIEMFEKDLKDNLYKVWNRMSSGTYFPPPVRAVEIPKSSGGTRLLGVPAVGDRVAQTVAALALEPRTEAIFHDDSYGYRPRKGALDAVGRCRERCWARDWVIDLDVRKFFDSVPWDLMVKAVQANTTHEQRWIVLYVRQVAGRAHRDARRQDAGTGQGNPAGIRGISPVLANLFMHYAFDTWLEREFPAVEFERYADDAVVHCATERQAREVLAALESGWPRSGCDCTRTRPGSCTARTGNGATGLRAHVVHLPGLHVPRQECPDPGRDQHVHRVPARGQQGRPQENERGSPLLAHPPAHRHGTGDLAAWINPVVRGWVTYYGRYYRTALNRLLKRINTYLVRWAQRKYKRLRPFRKAPELVARPTERQPRISPTGPG